ncbi:tetratricopeptide repeat protein [Pontibacter liquoris]|uniref:type IX secretion system periplasmic lipoprotein PorW/SprE n=1 Tax=Pontibacter liquoris TaxID=2905677 RepID=UPI001FA6F8B5|nr:tetratricopeptide repeat protein [Pontibacter liquoris]
MTAHIGQHSCCKAILFILTLAFIPYTIVLKHPAPILTLNKQPLHLFLLLLALLLGSCSAERHNPLSKAYHNTTARYNGYFLANEKMRALEAGLQQQMQYDYSQVLPIYPTIDSTTAKAMAADLEDVVKKASFPIQWHKNSKWIDDSYLLVGQAQFYQLNFAEAAKTFKYVNATSKDKNARHAAMVWLMRSFLKMGEMDNAQAVSEFLRKERLNRENARELYLARAQYNTITGDTAAVVENLALALPNFEEKDALSRTRFTLAQLYQLTGQNKEAYQQYSKVLRKNPPYDLGFFSRLNLGQVSELSDAQDLERIAGYYRKMLKDDKNKEYRDKIYYEMAQFELRQQHYDKALEYLQLSLKTPGALPNQKAYSYVSAGEIYFDNLSKYNLAEAYYDSAVQVYPQNALTYAAVAERRDVLADFAKQYTTIQTQDSLQRLAKLPEAERMDFLRQLVQRQEEARQQEQLKQQQQQTARQREREAPRGNNNRNNKNGSAFADEGSAAGGVWYFDNPAAMASARSEFIRRWGDRPLQDFWRTRSRGESGQQPQLAEVPVADEPEESQASPEERADAQLNAYLQNIPLTTADLQRSEKEVEEALFNLANIYAQKLKDPAQAIKTYEQLLQHFPRSEHTAETFYSLYLLYGKSGDTQQQQVYYNRIRKEFPNTTYARLVDDADFMSKNAVDNLKAHALYDSAYTMYEAEEYKKAAKLLDNVVSRYPLNDIPDKIAFLEALVTARTSPPKALRDQLLRFKAAYPGSALQPQADALLTSYTQLEQENKLRKEAPAPKSARKPTAKTSQTREEKINALMAVAAKPATPAQETPATPKAENATQKPAATADKAPDKPVAVKEQNAPRPASPVQASPPAASAQPDTAAAAGNPAVVAEKDPLAYEAAPDSAYYFVLVYPAAAPAFKDITAKYAKYNNTYNRNLNLQTDSVALAGGKTMLVLRAFADPKVALSYNIKQKGPQAPVGRIRGVEFTTFVISSANYRKFMQKQDLEAYLTFFRNNY